MSRPVAPRFQIERWPTERPLFVLALAASIALWALLALSVIGLVYVALLGGFFFGAHLVLVAHVRGSGVKLGPDQFPELHASVERLAAEMGMDTPEVYLMQAGGALNAFATRLFGGELIVLYSDLLEACGEDDAARAMIVGHELAHLKCGHLRAQWLILPGRFVPFLGSALSRAREYTCDRYGRAAAGSVQGAQLGLAILAAGPRYGRALNLEAFDRQRADVNTGLMTLAEWLGSHPPLAKRVAALNPERTLPGYDPARGRLRAAALVGGGIVALAAVGLGVGAAAGLPRIVRQLNERMAADLSASPSGAAAPAASGADPAPDSERAPVSREDAVVLAARARSDLAKLALFIDQAWSREALPETIEEVEDRWQERRPGVSFPVDPYDGYEYGYELDDQGGYVLWSPGPDGEDDTDDDIERVGPTASGPRI